MRVPVTETSSRGHAVARIPDPAAIVGSCDHRDERPNAISIATVALTLLRGAREMGSIGLFFIMGSQKEEVLESRRLPLRADGSCAVRHESCGFFRGLIRPRACIPLWKPLSKNAMPLRGPDFMKCIYKEYQIVCATNRAAFFASRARWLECGLPRARLIPSGHAPGVRRGRIFELRRRRALRETRPKRQVYLLR